MAMKDVTAVLAPWRMGGWIKLGTGYNVTEIGCREGVSGTDTAELLLLTTCLRSNAAWTERRGLSG